MSVPSDITTYNVHKSSGRFTPHNSGVPYIEDSTGAFLANEGRNYDEKNKFFSCVFQEQTTGSKRAVDISGGLITQGLYINGSDSTDVSYLSMRGLRDGAEIVSPHPFVFNIDNNDVLTVNDVGTNAISKQFVINHPVRENYKLRHSCIETPQAANMYTGKSTLENGTKTINIDQHFNMTEGTFLALNKNTYVATSNESNYDKVKGSIAGNILTLACKNNDSNAIISWNVFGVRRDDSVIKTPLTDDDGNYITEYVS